MANLIPGAATVEPLFQSRDFLLKSVRMETTTEVQTLALINMAITDVRLEIFTSLGASRAMEIAGYTSEENPTSTNGILKARAQITEAYMVTYKLVALLPTFFMENYSKVNEEFNDEPLTRDASAVRAFQDTLKKTIDTNLNLLKEPEEEGTGESGATLIERQDDDGESDPYIIDDNFVGLSWGQE